jgi:hypothetical protein
MASTTGAQYQQLLAMLRQAYAAYESNTDGYSQAIGIYFNGINFNGLADEIKKYLRRVKASTSSVNNAYTNLINNFIAAINSVQHAPGTGNDDESVNSVHSDFSTDLRNMHHPNFTRSASLASQATALSELTTGNMSRQSSGFSFGFGSNQSSPRGTSNAMEMDRTNSNYSFGLLSRTSSAGSTGGYNDYSPRTQQIHQEFAKFWNGNGN